jgi:flagellar assembly protein FliH
MSSLPLAELSESRGFASDPRFAGVIQPHPLPEAVDEDPVARAWSEGHAAGLTQAWAEAEARQQADEEARARIELALARLDSELTEALRARLFATVAALCEAAVAPLALDPERLAARAARASEMLARADDDKVLRLHPDDLALVAARLPEDLSVEPDPSLERGALRLEAGSGGVEDGPNHWRRAIAEALAEC